MPPASLWPLAGFAFTLALGIFAWSRRADAALQRAFAALNFAVAAWNLDVFLLFTVRDGATAARIDRVFQFPMLAIPFLALRFFAVWLAIPYRRPLLRATGAWTAALWLASLGDGFLAGWERHGYGWWGRAGSRYLLFVGTLVAYLALSSALLWLEARRAADPQRRAQARWLLAANAVMGVASLTNCLPLYGVPVLPLGHLASVCYVFVIAFAMARHRLMDARVLVRAGMLYSALTFLLSVIYWGLVLGLQHWFQREVFEGSLVLSMLPALATALAVGPLKASLQERLDRTFFRSRAQRQDRLARFAEALAPLEREPEVWHAAWRHGWSLLHPDGHLLLVAQGGALVPARAGETEAHPGADRFFPPGAGTRRLDPRESGGWEVAVPVVGTEGLIAGCLLGPREHGVRYGSEDLAYVSAIAHQTALAVERVRLRERVRVEERHAALGRLTGVLSHEMNNFLNVISGAAGLLRRRLRAPEDVDAVVTVQEQVRRGKGFVREVLAACRVPRPHLCDVDLAPCLREFAREWRLEGSPACTLEVEVPPEGLRVRADLFQVRQVLENLVNNAAEACLGAGRVTVRALESGGGASIAVEDDGPGFPAEELPHLFEPFRTTKHLGTGLGLSIVKGIVDAHGGRVAAGNGPHGGGAVRIWIPGPGPGRGEG